MTSRPRASRLLSGALALFVAMADTGCVGAPPPDADEPVLAWASFEVVSPPGVDSVTFRFDVRSYTRSAANEFTEVPLPGLVSALQFDRPLGDRIRMTLRFDTSESGEDVRVEMEPVLELLEVVPELHAPPVLRLVWGNEEVTCVFESVVTTFESVDPVGVPTRASLDVSLREYLTFEQQTGGLNLE